MNNQRIIEKLYLLQQMVRDKNQAVHRALDNATIPLLECELPLSEAKKSELLKLKGVGPRVVEFIKRLADGDSPHEIACDVPATQRPEAERKPFRKRFKGRLPRW